MTWAGLLLAVLCGGCSDPAAPAKLHIRVLDQGDREVGFFKRVGAFRYGGVGGVPIAPQVSPVAREGDCYPARPLSAGERLVVWFPGCRPVEIAENPSGGTVPVMLECGYPFDIVWRTDVPRPAPAMIVQATWRGDGTHPEAIQRTLFQAAGVEPGSLDWRLAEFLDGVLMAPGVARIRVYVPWPGTYRVTWEHGTVDLGEGEQARTWSKSMVRFRADVASVSIPGDGTAPVVEIPAKR